MADMKNISAMPSKRALAVLDEPPPAEPINKALRITHKVRRAIDAMVSGDCRLIREAAEKAGLAPESLSRALDKPHVAAFLRQKVLKRLGIAAARAGATKIELLDSANEIVRDRSSSFVLGLSGIQPETGPSVAVNLEVRAGFVIDLTEPNDAAPVRIVSGTSTRPAAPAVD